MAKYTKRVDSFVSENTKSKLQAIKKENNDITIRYILEKFVEDYCETEPKGIKLKIKQLEDDKKEIEDQINTLHENKIKIDIEIKTYRDKLNKTLDNYIDTDLTKSVKSIANICKDQNYYTFDDIPEPTFIKIAKNNKIEVETLKQEVSKELF